MPSEVILPRVDMDMATGKIAKWYVEDGATVDKGQPLFEIETDKAAMEIEAPSSGIIRGLADASGRDIPVGSVIAWIYAEGEPAVPAAPSLPQAADRAPRRADAEVPDEATRPPSPAAPLPVGRLNATPLARRLARGRGIDLTTLQGSGPHGRIQARDVERTGVASAPPASPPPAPPLTTPPPAAASSASVEAAAAAPLPPLTVTRTNPSALPALIQLREGTGRPILLLHGFGADANGWRPFLSGRPLDRPVLALDLPGHGGSALGAVASFAGLVDAAEAALAAANIPALDLVGHSLGAAVAAAIAARGSHDIRSLLLLAPAGLGPEINGDFLRGYLTASAVASLTPWMHELVVDPGVITPAFIRSTLKARAESTLAASQRAVADAVFPDGTQSFSIRGDLLRLAMPTRVVFGTADRIIPARHAAGLPGAVALHLFANVGHMPHLEAPDMVAAIIAEMVRL